MIEGYLFLIGELDRLTRIMLGVVGVVLLIPHQGIVWIAIGIAVVIARVFWGLLRQRKLQYSIGQAENGDTEQGK